MPWIHKLKQKNVIQENFSHCLHLNLYTLRIWCYECESEMFPLNNNPAISPNLRPIFSQDELQYQSKLFGKDIGLIMIANIFWYRKSKLTISYRYCGSSKFRKYMLHECCSASSFKYFSHDSVFPQMCSSSWYGTHSTMLFFYITFKSILKQIRIKNWEKR